MATDEEEPRNTAEDNSSTREHSPASHKRRRSRSSSGSDGRKRSASPLEEGEAVSSTPADVPSASDPPLPDEEAPPLPDEAPPEDDGWDAMWDNNAQAYYFFNRFTQASQWENPRVPNAASANYGSYDRYTHSAAPGTTSSSGAPGTSAPGTSAPGTSAPGTSSPPRRRAGGYNPAIHGSYDPNADYAREAQKQEEEEAAAAEVAAAVAAGLPAPSQDYAATGHFNRFTGRFQNETINPDLHNDENKSKRQMSAFFDVDAAANSHDGRSLKAERRGKSLSKKELKAFKDKRREKKEEKRRAWLRD